MRCFYCMEEYDEDIDVICPFCGNDVVDLSNESFCLSAGSVLKDRYIVGRVLGNGGFGITYIGYDKTLKRKIAIKEFFPPECASRQSGEKEVCPYSGERGEHYESGLKSFEEEALRLANLGSIEGVVNVYDVFPENGTAYIVMEYLSGETVAQMLKRRKTLGFGTTMNIIVPVLRSLVKVHRAGLIHRDISPQNIIRTTDGKIVLIDFGAARQNSLTMSRSLSVILKQGYAPIEQYDNKLEQASWTDVYATAATMYTMLTGVTPDYANTRLLSDTLLPVSELKDGLPPQLDGILAKALAIRPEDRTQTAQELLDELMSLKDFKRPPKDKAVRKNPDKVSTQKIPKNSDLRYNGKTGENAKWRTYVRERPIESGIVSEMEYQADTLTSSKIDKPVAFVKNTEEETDEVPKSVKVSKPLIFVTVLALLVLGCLVTIGYLDRRNNIEVPNFVGQNINDVLGNSEYEFNFEVFNVYTTDTDLDVIVEQSPVSSSRRVKKDSQVRLTVNSLDTEVTIPVLSKLSQSAAINTLESLNLESEIVVVQDDQYEEGTVIRTEPANGSKVKVLTKVTVYVAENSVPAPNLVGKLYEEAVAELESVGLHIGEATYNYSDEYDAGYIMSQDPVENTSLEKDSSVSVVVSLGPPYEVLLNTSVDLSGLKTPFKVSVMVDGEQDSEKTYYSLVFRSTYDIEISRLNTSGSLPVTVYVDGELYQEYEFDFTNEKVYLNATYEVSAQKDSSSDDENSDDDKNSSDNESDDDSDKTTDSDTVSSESGVSQNLNPNSSLPAISMPPTSSANTSEQDE